MQWKNLLPVPFPREHNIDVACIILVIAALTTESKLCSLAFYSDNIQSQPFLQFASYVAFTVQQVSCIALPCLIRSCSFFI